MKDKFKIGQWFDTRKFSGWQKQWCLDNLDWITAQSKDQISGDMFSLVRYGYFYGQVIGFGTTTDRYTKPENEITFNEFYWGEDETLPEEESIFDNPKWVTANYNLELSQGLELISGEDYKVISVAKLEEGGMLYKVVNGLGVEREYDENYFHKVTPQDLLPNECKDDEDSFDKLVYVGPKEDVSILYDTLSSEQLTFLLSNLTFSTVYGHNEPDATHLSYDYREGVWFTERTEPVATDTIVFFNNIFQGVN